MGHCILLWWVWDVPAMRIERMTEEDTFMSLSSCQMCPQCVSNAWQKRILLWVWVHVRSARNTYRTHDRRGYFSESEFMPDVPAMRIERMTEEDTFRYCMIGLHHVGKYGATCMTDIHVASIRTRSARRQKYLMATLFSHLRNNLMVGFSFCGRLINCWEPFRNYFAYRSTQGRGGWNRTNTDTNRRSAHAYTHRMWHV